MHADSAIQSPWSNSRGITITILVDFIHVLEYLWKAAWCFCPRATRPPGTGSPRKAWTSCTARSPRSSGRIQALAAAGPPKPGSEHAKIIRATLAYLAAKQPDLDYPRALANGWPIATGISKAASRL
jgi:hypothetical protein